MPSIPFYGEILALSTAFVWAIAVILFRKSGETVPPIGLNLFKNILAFLLILPTMVLTGQALVVEASLSDYLLLFASGVIGLGIADTLFFMCLNRLGAGLTAIVDSLYSPSIIFLAMIFLAETLTGWQIVGAVLIVSAVLSVTWRRRKSPISQKDRLFGVIFGALGMIAQAVGIVMIKPLLNRSPVLWVVEHRLAGGIFVLFLAVLLHPKRREIVDSVLKTRAPGYMVSGSFLGAYLAVMLWMGGMKYTLASTASALNQTSNVFIFILAAVLLQEPINLKRLVGIALAVAGVLLVTFMG